MDARGTSSSRERKIRSPLELLKFAGIHGDVECILWQFTDPFWIDLVGFYLSESGMKLPEHFTKAEARPMLSGVFNRWR